MNSCTVVSCHILCSECPHCGCEECGSGWTFKFMCFSSQWPRTSIGESAEEKHPWTNAGAPSAASLGLSSGTPSMEAVRCMLALAAKERMFVDALDCSTAFMHSPLPRGQSSALMMPRATAELLDATALLLATRSDQLHMQELAQQGVSRCPLTELWSSIFPLSVDLVKTCLKPKSPDLALSYIMLESCWSFTPIFCS